MPKDYKSEWSEVWSRGGASAAFIGAGRRFYNKFFARLLDPYLGSDKTILELGCGTATLLLLISPCVKKVVGLDITDEALAISRNNFRLAGALNAEFIQGDCRDVPFTDSFDVVWSQGLLEHFDDTEVIVRQHFKALRPGGAALISVPYRYSYHYLWYLCTRPKFLRRFWPWTEQNFLTRRTLLAIGKKVTDNARVFLLRPFILGIVILELKK